MGSVKNKTIATITTAILIAMLSITKANAQSTFFSISELRISTAEMDTSIVSNNTRVIVSMKISDVKLASTIHLELAEVMHNFTLYTSQGIFTDDEGGTQVSIDGRKQTVSGKWVSFDFEVPTALIKQWKFTRVYMDLKTGDKSKYLYHRW